MMKHVFYLVKWNNGSTEEIYWLKKSSDSKWEWPSGCSLFYTDGHIFTVLEEVYCEAEELDQWKLPWIKEKEYSDSGWLSPKGKWYPCEYHQHALIVARLFDKEWCDLEQEGYVKVQCGIYIFWIGMKNPLKRITRQQSRFLNKRGFVASSYNQNLEGIDILRV